MVYNHLCNRVCVLLKKEVKTYVCYAITNNQYSIEYHVLCLRYVCRFMCSCGVDGGFWYDSNRAVAWTVARLL